MIDFEKANKSALKLNQIATEDYLGARCCLLNGLIQPGYVMACQALEKILKCHILLILPSENFKKSKQYPYHDLEVLLEKLISISKIELDQFKDLCFRLSKAYHSLRYPDNPHITTYGINSLSTAILEEVDEMFVYLFERLPVPDELKCRIGLLAVVLILRDVPAKTWFLQANKAYHKRINYFNRPLEWWSMTEEQKKQAPSITILSVNGTNCIM